MPYYPDAIPEDTPPALKAWLAEQLRRVAAVVNQGVFATPIGAEPARPRNGMIVYAIDPWATDSFSGVEGFYGYEDGNWVKL
jgi:hypothetical protein